MLNAYIARLDPCFLEDSSIANHVMLDTYAYSRGYVV